MRLPLPLGPAAVLLVMVAGGCEVPLASPSVTRQAVVGGTLEWGYPFVGAIVAVTPTCGEPFEDSRVTCTGTLVAPRVVLTAAHCVENLDIPQGLWVVFAPEVEQALPSERVRVIEGRVHPAWLPGVNDIGVLILAGDAPTAPVALEGAGLPPVAVGQFTRVVGFGLDEQERLGSRRSGSAQVTAVQAGTFSIAAAPGMSCGGDSGGPVFLEADGAERLVGITSYGNLACTTGTNTRVDVHAAFVQEIQEEVARAPRTRTPMDPAVDACTLRCRTTPTAPGDGLRPPPQRGEELRGGGPRGRSLWRGLYGTEGDVLCVKAGAMCRQWLPCAKPEPEPEPEKHGGGCAVTGGTRDTSGMFSALLVLAACLCSRLRHNGCHEAQRLEA